MANREYMSHGTATEVKVSGECMLCALFYGVQTVLSVWPPREKIVREAPGGRVNGPFLQLILVCGMLLLTQWYR